MEAPPVHYTSTSDGISIAWAGYGQGPTLLICPATPFSHVQEQCLVYGDYYEAVYRLFRMVTFDARGTGMSEREVARVSAETLVLDAEAVIEAAKLDRFVVLAAAGNLLALSTALRLAITYPERVTHAVLESPYQNSRELADTLFGRTGPALAELDWTVFTQTLARVLLGWDAATSELIEPFANAVGGWVDQSVGVPYAREVEAIDVGELLPEVGQPTLVIRNDPYFVPARCCQRVAARISGAQFRQYSDPTYLRQPELVRAFVDQTLLGVPLDAPAVTAVRQGTAIILFADIADSTALTERLGDAAFREKARELDTALRSAITSNGGTAIEGKLLGDGVLATFGAAREAIACAMAIHGAGRHVGLPLHVGIHAGDVIRESNNVYGGAVNIASRVAGEAAAGETLVSGTVRDLARTSAGVSFEDRGERELKGVGEPVRVWAVR